MDADEDQWIRCQEEVQDSVDEAHVDGEQKNDGLSKEEAQRSRKVLGDKLAEVDFDLLLLGVDTPVLGATAEIGSLVHEDNRRVCLLEE